MKKMLLWMLCAVLLLAALPVALAEEDVEMVPVLAQVPELVVEPVELMLLLHLGHKPEFAADNMLGYFAPLDKYKLVPADNYNMA